MFDRSKNGLGMCVIAAVLGTACTFLIAHIIYRYWLLIPLNFVSSCFLKKLCTYWLIHATFKLNILGSNPSKRAWSYNETQLSVKILLGLFSRHSNFLYSKSWLPCLYFAAACTFGTVGRQLALVGGLWTFCLFRYSVWCKKIQLLRYWMSINLIMYYF